VRLHRLCRRGFRELDGEGALLYGGRWNSPGRPAVYASRALSLAALELLVHIDPARAPTDLIALAIEVPDALVISLDVARLPKKWRDFPAAKTCAVLGDEWLEEMASVGLVVPSAIVPGEENVILNPRHPEFRKVKVVGEEGFGFDARLV
jgi:RES domain-containing protein